MFDINTILNAALTAAVESAIKPLVERIEAQDKTITELNAFIAQWNFNEDGFKKAFIDLIENDSEVVTAVSDCVTDSIDVCVERAVERYMDNFDFSDAISSTIGDVDDKLDRIKECVKDEIVEYITNNATITIS